MENKIREILHFIFDGVNDGSVETYSTDTISEWDSMKQVLIIGALENEFDVFIEADEAATLTSYTKIVDYLA